METGSAITLILLSYFGIAMIVALFIYSVPNTTFSESVGVALIWPVALIVWLIRAIIEGIKFIFL